MATPNSPAQQSYSAGSCRLEVTLQLSALSQWYPQPVANDLSFQLWLQSAGIAAGITADMALVAEGDRATLQAIADSIQQQIQSTLAIAQLGRSSGLSAVTASPLTQIANLPLEQSLSYLQLCDLSTVLSQYQQTIKTLPVALSPATASTLDALNAQRLEDAQAPQNQIIPFPLNRTNRPTRWGRSKIWASSAAAAVFTVGLTATLWPNISSQVAQTGADSTLLEPVEPNTAPEPESSAPADQTVASAPESGSANRSENSNRPANRLQTNPNNRLQTSPGNRIETADKPDAAPAAPSSQTASDGQPSRNANRNTQRESGSSAPTETAPTAPAQSAKVPAAEENPPTISPSTVNPPTRPPIIAAEPEATQSADSLAGAANTAPSSSAAAPSAARLAMPPLPAAVIVQVQSYFQSQWQSQWQATRAADRQAIQAPLVYRLQLSETGAVVSFTALNDQARVWRDRLLPASNPPTFSAVTTATADSAQPNNPNLVLRLTVTTDGQVQVSEF